MKISVISDTHIPATCESLPQKVANLLKGADLIVHAGDLTELNVLDELKKIAPVEAVYGNMDSVILLRQLPLRKVINVGAFKLGIIHGNGAPGNLISYIRQNFKDERVDCIIYGHSHTAAIDIIDNTIYFNPGSPTDTIFAPYNSIGTLDIGKEIVPEIIKL